MFNYTHFHQLTPAEHERLALLSEELGETQQAIGKILRHGYESRNPEVPDSPTNRENLMREIGDVVCATGLMFDAGDIDEAAVAERIVKKTRKVKQYLHHQT